MLKLGSLFSGIGGFELGLERTGEFRTIWQCEIDKYACKVLEKHWPDVPNLGDTTEVDWNEVERPDVICGGFPCQDISIAGKGKGIKGARSGLWRHFAEAISVLRPDYAIVENVPMLDRRGLDRVLGTLSEIGYDAEWNIVSARFVGANHRRDRIFIVAHSNGQRQLHRGDEEHTDNRGLETLADSLEGGQEMAHPKGELQGYGNLEYVPILRNGQKEWEEGGSIQSREWWAVEPHVDRVANGVPNRVERIRCLGNAIVPQVAEYIGECLLSYMKESD